METRQIHVRDLSTVTGIQQYEHCVQSIFFLGLEDFEGTIYLSIESDKFSEDVALTNNTFIIGQPMTKFNVTYTCQIYGIVGTGEKIQLSKQFRMVVYKSNNISGEAGEYPIDPNIVNGIDQYVTEKESQIDDYVEQVIESIPSDYTALSNKSNGRDMLSPNVMMAGYCSNTGVENLTRTNYEMMSDYIEVEPSTVYTLFGFVTITQTGYWHRFCWYDENKDFISSSQDARATTGYYVAHKTVTSPSTARYLRVSFRSFLDGVLSLYQGEYTEAIKPNWYTNIHRPHPSDVYNVKSIAHRGYYGAPENTLPAYAEAKQHGFKFVECDIDFTSDNVPVLLHDSTINRTARNADGTEISSTINIRDITYAQALEYDFGVWKDEAYTGTKIPTFEEFISLCYDLNLHAYIDINTLSYVRDNIYRVVDIVQAHDMMDRVTFISSSAFTITKIKTLAPTARLGVVSDNNVTWSDVLRICHQMQSETNSVVLIARKQSVNPLGENYIDGWNVFIDDGIPIETWTIYSYDTSMFDRNKALSGYITETISYDDYMAEKWGIES